MAKIVMAVHDTVENQRYKYTEQTLLSLIDTVDFKKHDLFISDNGSCKTTKQLYIQAMESIRNIEICYNGENLGTARAVNKGIAKRKPNQHVIKMDNDVVFHKKGWADEMEFVINREPTIGILGLKRKDLRQSPFDEDPAFRTKVMMLRHEHGEPWYILEKSRDIMGTCTMLNYALLDKIGYFIQPNVYGFDDTLLSTRSLAAGFHNYFLHGIEIDHIDTGGDLYCKWKEDKAAEGWDEYKRLEAGYLDGSINYFYNGN